MPYYRYYSNELPTCPRCEIRPVYMRSNGKPYEACVECKNAEQALRHYWRVKGLPLAWHKPHRRWLTPLPPRQRTSPPGVA